MQSFRIARGPTLQTSRFFATTSLASRALPFSLNPYRSSLKDEEHSGRVLRMLMFGKPGAGKGTLTARLVKKYDILSLSTGDLLRQHIKEGTEVGRLAEGIVADGGLLPDDIVLKVVTSKLDLLCNRVCIFVHEILNPPHWQ